MGFEYGGNKAGGGQISRPGYHAPAKAKLPKQPSKKGSSKLYDVSRKIEKTRPKPGKVRGPIDMSGNTSHAPTKPLPPPAPPPPAPDPATANWGLADQATDKMYGYDPSLIAKSAAGSAKADQRAIDGQTRAMDELFGLYNKGGATAQDRAFAANARAESEGALRSQRDAWGQDLAERGMGNSGGEMAMMLGGMQDFGSRQAKADLDMQGLHEARAMDALMKGGDLAGAARNSSFNEDFSRGQGTDAISQLNQAATNQASEFGTKYKQEMYKDLQNKKFQARENELGRQAQVAMAKYQSDIDVGQDARNDATSLAGGNAATHAGATGNVIGQMNQLPGATDLLPPEVGSGAGKPNVKPPEDPIP